MYLVKSDNRKKTCNKVVDCWTFGRIAFLVFHCSPFIKIGQKIATKTKLYCTHECIHAHVWKSQKDTKSTKLDFLPVLAFSTPYFTLKHAIYTTVTTTLWYHLFYKRKTFRLTKRPLVPYKKSKHECIPMHLLTLTRHKKRRKKHCCCTNDCRYYYAAAT